MRKVTQQMIDMWQMSNMDWMGYTLEKKERFSFHHLIIPKKDGGPYSIDNGAILIQQAGHDYLHCIQRTDEELFQELTNILIEINKQRFMPTMEQLMRINEILEYFENKHEYDVNSHGNLLVKNRYLRRVQK